MIYLDIVLIVNGAMDAFLLIYTAHLLRKKVRVFNIILAVILGELPVLLIIFGFSGLATVSKILVPIAMVKIGLSTEGIRGLARGLLYFSLLAAISGGIYYALSGWLGLGTGQGEYITLSYIWIFPLIALLMTGGHRVWEKRQKDNLKFDNVLYDVEITFENDKKLIVKALLDTGNELRDPLTGAPVMILEERVARSFLPEKIQQFLLLPWKESSNPWSYIWNDEEYCVQKMVFISARGINGQTWLPGIRLGKTKISQGEKEWEQSVTVALVPQVLSSENKFQALLHPGHIQKPANREEIA